MTRGSWIVNRSDIRYPIPDTRYPISAWLVTCHLLLVTLLLSGCVAMPGPTISHAEYEAARGALQAKALRYRYAQSIRVQSVGMRLLQALPPEIRTSQTPYVGLILDVLDQPVAEALGVSAPAWTARPWESRAIVVTGVVPDGPAARAGVEAGDLVRQVAGFPVRTADDAVVAFKRLHPGAMVQVLLEREGIPHWVNLPVEAKPYPVSFQLIADGPEADAWNAYAAPGRIVVTARLLQFMRSDDELAVVIGHELAHLTSGHIVKGMGTSLIGSVLANTIAQVTGVDLLGDVSGGIVHGAFSREFEREADYVGLQYAYRAGFDITAAPELWERVATELPRRATIPWLSTHPSDPERLARLTKVVNDLKRQDSSAAPALRPPHRD